MALVLSGSIDISGSMTATTILISSPGAAGMVSSSAQITELAPLMQSTSSINNLTGSLITTSSNNVIAIDGLNTYTASLKGAAIVSSSQQVQNYFTFAQTSSANTFYGTQTIKNNSGGTQGIDFQNYSTSGVLGQIIYSQSDDTLNIVNTSAFAAGGIVLKTNSTEKLRVATSGRLGLEVPTPDINTKLHIADTANGYVGIRLSGSGNFTGTDWTLYASSDSAPSANDFFGIYNNSATDSATEDYKLKVYKNGNVNIVNGNLVIGTSGKGIDFSATSNSSGTMTSELLNDYEEGTWTPVLSGGTSGTATSGANTYGNYTKIGRLVTLNFVVTLTSVNTLTGAVYLTGIPFNLAAGASLENRYPQGSVLFQVLTTSWTSILIGSDGNTTKLLFAGAKTAATSTVGLMDSDLAATTTLAGSIQYIA